MMVSRGLGVACTCPGETPTECWSSMMAMYILTGRIDRAGYDLAMQNPEVPECIEKLRPIYGGAPTLPPIPTPSVLPWPGFPGIHTEVPRAAAGEVITQPNQTRLSTDTSVVAPVTQQPSIVQTAQALAAGTGAGGAGIMDWIRANQTLLLIGGAGLAALFFLGRK